MITILQKEIYKSGKITGAVRILKEQEILPDDSTLVQHNISDGNTVNVLIEPEHDISIEVQCGPKVYKHNVSNCMTVKELKMLFIESNQVTFLYKEFNFETYVTSKGIKQKQFLDDETLPLHFFSLDKYVKVKVVGPYVLLQSENQLGEILFHKISEKCMVSGLKKVIMKSAGKEDVTDISMFVTCGNECYKKLDVTKNEAVGNLLPKSKKVNFIEERLSFKHRWPV